MQYSNPLRCPVCGGSLSLRGKTASCAAGHAFDVAREGYVNLLRAQRSGDRMGDSKDSARSRRDFLDKGYYAPLRDALRVLFADKRGTVLDICCGEGYYTAALAENPALAVYGFDLSREMVRLAARRGGATCFVANLAAIPVADASFDYATHLFAPFHAQEFSRILRPGGTLYTVVPGERHLWALKEALYDKPYPNDEKLPAAEPLTLCGTQKLTAEITLRSPQDIEAVFRMTPYYYHTGQRDRDKLKALQTLTTEISFVIAAYKKPR
ncbi:MAG: methyltransferase domain-containing protein [Oscillospiraceae bacterium]|nr:methyltransferase domain-containing protein [Oscillospiraceae bacterium]